jgi:hypothetical protein
LDKSYMVRSMIQIVECTAQEFLSEACE